MIALRLDPRLAGRVSASDVLQDSYLEAAKRLDHLMAKPDLPPLVWLRLIAGQRLIDVHRQHLGAQMRDAGQEISINRNDGFFAASSICLAAQLVGAGTSPSEAAVRLEQRAKLEQALESLDPIDREVLALRHFEELGNREIAAMLGIEPSAASKRYLRALERLRAVLETMPGVLDRSLGSKSDGE
jgi:RNA polymerase sigma-70 factor (ECF subfamily)